MKWNELGWSLDLLSCKVVKVEEYLITRSSSFVCRDNIEYPAPIILEGSRNELHAWQYILCFKDGAVSLHPIMHA